MTALETKIKYIGVKFKKGLKKSAIASSGIIKDADNLSVRILLFLLCFRAKDLEKIDIDFLRRHVGEFLEDDTVIAVLDYFKGKEILDYKYEKTENIEHKGANMDIIVSLIGNISNNINTMIIGEYKEPEATQEQLEFEKIYRIGKAGATGHREDEESVKFEKVGFGVGTIDMEAEDESDNVREADKSDEEIDEGFDIVEKSVISNEQIAAEHVSEAAVPPIEIEHITIEMVCEELEKNDAFRDLYEGIQHNLKTIINPNELEILYNLYAKIQAELLVKISEYCGENSNNPKTVIRYFESTALGLLERGITTSEQYDKMVDDARKADEYEIKIREMFALGDKKMTAKEYRLIKTWVLEYNLSDDLLQEAYKRAEKQNKVTIPYINKILETWHGQGFKTFDDLKGEVKNYQTGFGNAGKDAMKQVPAGFNSEHVKDKIARQSKKLLELLD